MMRRTMSATDPRIGTSIGGYRIESVLGRGGMSVVYLAEHERLKRKAALKVLSPELAGDETFRRRFVAEWERLAGLDHPNIIPIFEAGETEGLLYIAMRYVETTDLKGMIRAEGRLAPARAMAIATQVASALDAAHAHSLVHRDVKPGNVLIAPGAGSRSTTPTGRPSLTNDRLGERAHEDRELHGHDRLRRSPSRSPARRWTAGPTSTRSPACCSRA
jgi:serine/threonine protein kinase